MSINEPLLREAMTFIRLHQERWDQGSWGGVGRCGTTHCLAGWVCAIAGNQLNELAHTDERAFWQAKELLGLDYEQANSLFYFTWIFEEAAPGFPARPIRRPTYDDLVARVKEITGIDCKDGIESTFVRTESRAHERAHGGDFCAA